MSTVRLDSQLALAAARCGLARAPALVADHLARAARDVSDKRLEQLMRGPARGMVLEGIFWQLPKRLEGKRAAGISSSIRWYVTGRPDGGADIYQLELAGGRCRVVRSPQGPHARVTITLDGTEFVRIAAGRSNPVKAYLGGRLAVSGDRMAAASLGLLFWTRDIGASGAGSQGQWS